MEQKTETYDEQLERLTNYPEQIYDSWNDSEGFFKRRNWPISLDCDRCLTEFKYRFITYGYILHHNTPSFEIIQDLLNNGNIPFFMPTAGKIYFPIKVEHLKTFKEYAEKLDAAGII